MKVLAGDLGGTKTLLAIAECSGAAVSLRVERRYESTMFSGLEDMLRQFMADAGAAATGVERACIAVAGPVMEDAAGQRAHITNLPWHVDSARLAQSSGIAHVRLINDFQGVGYGIDALAPDDLVTLQAGVPVSHGPRAVIGAGTGLGECVLTWAQDHYEVLASEGGHTDFAPADAEQMELLGELRTEFGHVSWERLVSGPGLVRLHQFLSARHGIDYRAPAGDDPAAAISAAAFAGDETARQALDLFVRLYGAQAGNLALTVLASGGVYIAGGIAPKIIDKLRDGVFLKTFIAKDRMAPLLAAMPVHVVTNPRVGLLGAALAAGRLLISSEGRR